MMIRVMRHLVCFVPLLILIGCGGVKEEPPPLEAPKMSEEQKQYMEQHMQEMRKMYQKKR